MKLDEAKKILGSVGYSVSENLDGYFKNTVKSLMESLESRRATKTKSYQILSEMARFNGRYTGSFAGLEGAGSGACAGWMLHREVHRHPVGTAAVGLGALLGACGKREHPYI